MYNPTMLLDRSCSLRIHSIKGRRLCVINGSTLEHPASVAPNSSPKLCDDVNAEKGVDVDAGDGIDLEVVFS